MITAKKIDWMEACDRHFEECQGPDFSLRDMMREWLNEKAFLLGVFEYERHIGSILLRPDGNTLVIVAAGGKTIDGSSYVFMMPVLKNLASMFGFRCLRAHALDAARGRLLERSGWGKPEYVYCVNVGE